MYFLAWSGAEERTTARELDEKVVAPHRIHNRSQPKRVYTDLCNFALLVFFALLGFFHVMC